MTIEPPRRQTVTHRCRCVLVDNDPVRVQYGSGANRCGEAATPDSPFCPECDDRHPDLAGRGVTVTTARLP